MELKFHMFCCALSQTSRQIANVSVQLNLSPFKERGTNLLLWLGSEAEGRNDTQYLFYRK